MRFEPSDVELVGHVAGVLTTMCFLPQVMRTFRSRDVSGLSLPTFVLLTTGNACWLVYGLLKDSQPIITANAATLCLAASMVVMKLAFGKKPGKKIG